jgi:hypothetical protein
MRACESARGNLAGNRRGRIVCLYGPTLGAFRKGAPRRDGGAGWRRRRAGCARLALAPERCRAEPVSRRRRSSAGGRTPRGLTEDGDSCLLGAPHPRSRSEDVRGAAPLQDRRATSERVACLLTTASEVYTVDPETGAGSWSALSSVRRRDASGVDFTPLADCLRLVSHDGQNLRINVDAWGSDRWSAGHAPGDPNHRDARDCGGRARKPPGDGGDRDVRHRFSSRHLSSGSPQRWDPEHDQPARGRFPDARGF